MNRRDLERGGEGGFTLIETLVALALMGLVLSALANLTAQWLPNWNRGLDRIQRSETISIALQRIGDDLAAAEYVPANRDQKGPLFVGSEASVTFVRTALGPNAGAGLDVVHLGEATDAAGVATVRSRTSFHPMPIGSALSEQLHFGEPVVLMRAPFRLSFAYAGSGEDRAWKSRWQDGEKLPAKIRLTVRDASSARILAISTVTPVHVEESPSGDCKAGDGKCDTPPTAQNGNPQTGSQPVGAVAANRGSSQ